MQSAKETATNVAASAKAGMEKTKAAMQEKAEKMTTRDPLQKEMATEKKEARISEAERQKHEMRESAKAGRIHGDTTGYGGTTGGTGYGTTGYGSTIGGTGYGTTGYGGTTGGAGYGSTGTGYSDMTETGYPSETTGTQGVGSQYPTGGTTGGAGTGRTGVMDPRVHRSGAHRDTDTYYRDTDTY